MVARNNTTPRKRILIIEELDDESSLWGTSRTKSAQESPIANKAIHVLSELGARNKPVMFYFCRGRSSTRMDQFTKERVNKFILGDSGNERDLERALQKSKADIVILSSDRERDFMNLSVQGTLNAVLHRNEYRHVKLLVLSDENQSTNRASTIAPQTLEQKEELVPELRGTRALSGLDRFLDFLQCGKPRILSEMISERMIGIESLKINLDSPSNSTHSTTTNCSSTDETENSIIQRNLSPTKPLGKKTAPNFGSRRRPHLRIDQEDLAEFITEAVVKGTSFQYGSDNSLVAAISTE